jgi:hypothetical protein
LFFDQITGGKWRQLDSTRKEKAEPEAEQQQRFKGMKRRRQMTASEIQMPPTALGAAPPLAPGVPPPPPTPHAFALAAATALLIATENTLS